MYKILKAEFLAGNIFLMEIEAPRVAKSCEPGQNGSDSCSDYRSIH